MELKKKSQAVVSCIWGFPVALLSTPLKLFVLFLGETYGKLRSLAPDLELALFKTEVQLSV